MQNLTVYRASAGSGKTFQLTKEYLKILFDKNNQKKHRNILAVTFTNKATEEMKSRILNELNKLANKKESGYTDFLKKEFNYTDEGLAIQAEQILKSILHDYAKFTISTIDSFFQRIIRSFIKEINIQSGFQIELNNSSILQMAIDLLISKVDEKSNIKQWLTDFAFEKIESGKNWDFRKDISKLGNEIFNEDFQSFDKVLLDKLSEKEFLKKYRNELSQIINKIDKKAFDFGQEAIKIIQDEGLNVYDFSYNTSGIAGYFYKMSDSELIIPGARVLACKDNPDKWCPKTSPKKQSVENAFHNGLNRILSKSLEYYNANHIIYNSCKAVLENIYTLGILTDILTALRNYTSENNLFLLSDSAKLIHALINENDAPFIYEKIGNIYRHFMIDEFQDTSGLQWEDFKPLLENSIANNNFNLIVGDVKQSIYRWRNGDWNILSHKLQNQIHKHNIAFNELKENWRSKKTVIDTNNFIFSNASELLQAQFDLDQNDHTLGSIITEAYENVEQLIPSKTTNEGGYVDIQFFNEDDEDNYWKDQSFVKIIKIIEDLQDRGVQLRDIAILVRNKRSGQEIANYIIDYRSSNKDSKYRYDFISNESLFLNSSAPVQVIISVLQYLLEPRDNINSSFLINEFKQNILSDEGAADFIHINEKIEELFSNIDIYYLQSLPLYDLIEKIISIFKLYKLKSQLPYIQGLQEVVLRFLKNQPGGIYSFLSWWEEHKENEVLSVNEQQNAIKILTIHKSKGLEFKALIVPECNWTIDHNTLHTNILWCKPEIEPFKQLDLLPIKYKKDLRNTIFKDDYYKEKLSAYVDNLNLLYVALTRAEQELYVMTSYKTKKKKDAGMSTVADLLLEISKKHNNWNEESMQLIIGEQEKEKIKIEEEISNLSFDNYNVTAWQEKIRISLTHKEYFESEDDEYSKKDKIVYGNLMHQIFEKIETIDDVEPALKSILMEGKISNEEMNELKSKIDQLMQDNQVRSWFSGEWKVKNEADIILKSGKLKRPDRVMIKDNKAIVIDYKFGDKEEAKYLNQIKQYAEYLSGMGFKDIKAYIWYAQLGKIKEVN